MARTSDDVPVGRRARCLTAAITRVLPVLLIAFALLAGCGSGSEAPQEAPSEDSSGTRASTTAPDDGSSGASDTGSGAVDATDGSFSVELPPGWTSEEQYLTGTVVAAAQGDDPADQLLVSTFEDPSGAEDRAIYSAAGLADSDIACQRLEDSTAFGEPQLVFDCPQQVEGATVRRLLVPIEHDGRSILMLVQTAGETLDDTAAVGRPLLESLTWH